MVMFMLIFGPSAGDPDLCITSGDCGETTIGDELLGRLVGVRAWTLVGLSVLG